MFPTLQTIASPGGFNGAGIGDGITGTVNPNSLRWVLVMLGYLCITPDSNRALAISDLLAVFLVMMFAGDRVSGLLATAYAAMNAVFSAAYAVAWPATNPNAVGVADTSVLKLFDHVTRSASRPGMKFVPIRFPFLFPQMADPIA